jgi:hypothetical protein
MTALQGNFTHPTTRASMPAAYLLLDDVVVSLASQIAAIHYAIYYNAAAQAAGGDPTYRDHREAISPLFSNVPLAAIPAGSLDAQIRQAAYQFLQALPEFAGWVLVA